MRNKEILTVMAYFKNKEDSKVGAYFVRETYYLKLKRFGLNVNFLPPLWNEGLVDEINEMYDKSHGILLMGGSDVNPIVYGSEMHKETKVKEPERDMLEINLVKKALAEKKPLLGICRGCQIIAVASGGTLYQHIPELTNLKHGVSEDLGYDGLLSEDNYHEVFIERNSRIFDILGTDKVKINTGHHQAVKTLGENFMVSGKTADGIVEIIEAKDLNHFCFGFQGHIEAMNDITDKVFEAFVQSL